MDPRSYFFQSLVKDKSWRILELGPLNRPIADKKIYPNAFYCDIRCTEDVRRLYAGNDYLEATGIRVDPETIVPIDYVVKENYEKTFEDVEKFDCVIASHVLEHMEDLIFALRDIGTVLKTGGIFYMIYPDRRYCFDHFRTSASFRDAYHVFRNGSGKNAPMVFDFYYSVIPENRPSFFWNREGVLEQLPEASFEQAVKHYEQALEGARMDDVHYWPFTDMDFLKFLYDGIRAGLLPYRCISFAPCLRNDQQFMVALQYDRNVMSQPEEAARELAVVMEHALPDYYSAKDIELAQENEKMTSVIRSQTQAIELQGKAVEILEKQLNTQEQKIKDMASQLEEYKEIIREQEYVINCLNGNNMQ